MSKVLLDLGIVAGTGAVIAICAYGAGIYSRGDEPGMHGTLAEQDGNPRRWRLYAGFMGRSWPFGGHPPIVVHAGDHQPCRLSAAT